MDDDLRYAIEGVISGLQQVGVITAEQVPIIAQAICDAGKAGRSGTAHRCHELAAGVAKSLHCGELARH